ncbi:hypothetical protein BDQ94DRAFT_149770 [Aspergillus welwitschiae]|nr:hypothetical protein BDQ94DRAFT_149770 [Aspergillus welwitschiae]RDH29726.1 hypothetical protein BDQ94DRAFT_149770 [Aspergillus welwitschiae]
MMPSQINHLHPGTTASEPSGVFAGSGVIQDNARHPELQPWMICAYGFTAYETGLRILANA